MIKRRKIKKVLLKGGGNKMVASARLVNPTIIKDRDIIREVLAEVTRSPNQKAMERNKAASEFLKKIRG